MRLRVVFVDDWAEDGSLLVVPVPDDCCKSRVRGEAIAANLIAHPCRYLRREVIPRLTEELHKK